MTREEAKEWLPIIQAWAEGKPIQYQTDSGSWSDIIKDLYTGNHPSKYRIKPESKYQKLVEQVAILKEVANEYPGKTIENIIIQIEARVNESN